MKFLDRRDAGRRLAEQLALRRWSDPIVLALPRGGVPVAFEVARALHAPMDVFVARKVGAPGHPQFGIGAVAEGGVQVLDERTVARFGLNSDQLRRLVEVEERELQRRVEQYRGNRHLAYLRGRDVILVDDGLATGATAEASLIALKKQQPRSLVLAVPVCPKETRDRLVAAADEVICARIPSPFFAVSQWYRDFPQTSDEEVHELLASGVARPDGHLE